jgi:competence ComEA-like helix-hairpin-helix protein
MKKILNFNKLVMILLIALVAVPYALAEGPKETTEPNKIAININTAPVEELTKLKGVGPKYAQRIIDYREKVAPFSQPEDIMKVEGIGPKIFEANKDLIVVK